MSSSLSGFTGMGSRGQLGATQGGMGQRLSGNIVPKGYNVGQLQQFTPEQQGLFQQLFGYLGQGSQLSGLAGGDEAAFEQAEAPAHRQFQGLIGNLASRFSQGGGQGSLGARRSSGFQNATSQASSDFAQTLQANRQGLQRQALLDLMGLSQSLLGQRPYEQFLTKKPEKGSSFLQKLLGGILPVAGAGIGGAFGGPAGASLGGQLGGAAGQAFM